MSRVKRKSLCVDGVEVSLGFQGHIPLSVARMLTGEQTALPLHCVRGTLPGPVLGVLACVHGDEPHPIRTMYNILKKIKPEDLSGTLLLIPVSNPFAFANFSRQSPDQHEQTNLWGAFPGNSGGTLTQRYAAKIRETVIENADFLVEFHSGGLAGRIQRRVDIDHQIKGEAGSRARSMGIAFASGGARMVHGVPLGAASAPGFALASGIPAISVEIGGSYLTEAEEKPYRMAMESGFLNLMVHLSMLEGVEMRTPVTYFEAAARAEVNPAGGGYLLSRKTRFRDLGCKMKKGELLGEILDPFALKVNEQLRSPAEGVLFFSRCSGPVEVGNKGFAIATEAKKI